MTTCPNGHPQGPGARFCGTCGAAIAARAPTDQTIRPPAYVPPPAPWTPPAARPTTNWVPMLVAIVIAACLGLGALAYVVTRPEDVTAEAPVTTAAAEESDRTPLPDAAPSTTRTTATTTAPTIAVTTAPPATLAPSGTWIAVLESIDQDKVGAHVDVEESLDRAVATQWLYSDDYASLTPGYLVVYAGPYDTSAAAIETCHSLGYTSSSDCYAAPLSQDPADATVRIYP